MKLTTPVWQEQYRDTYIPFIEGLLHCREQYERLQAMPEFKKQLTIHYTLQHIRWHNDPKVCEGVTPMTMLTCQTITANPTLSPEEFLRALIAFKDTHRETEMVHAARAAKHPVMHGPLIGSIYRT